MPAFRINLVVLFEPHDVDAALEEHRRVERGRRLTLPPGQSGFCQRPAGGAAALA